MKFVAYIENNNNTISPLSIAEFSLWINERKYVYLRKNIYGSRIAVTVVNIKRNIILTDTLGMNHSA